MQQMDNGSSKKVKSKEAARESFKNIKRTITLVFIIILLIAIIFFGSIFMFDFLGLRSDVAKSMIKVPLIGKVMQPLIEDKTPLEIEQEELETAKKDLEIKEQQINEKQNELVLKEKELQDKEQELLLKEQEINTMTATLSDKITGVQEQVEYLEKIETSKAVQILLSMEEKETVVQVLRNMKKDKASQILAAMDPLQAAQLLEDISSKSAVDINTITDEKE